MSDGWNSDSETQQQTRTFSNSNYGGSSRARGFKPRGFKGNMSNRGRRDNQNQGDGDHRDRGGQRRDYGGNRGGQQRNYTGDRDHGDRGGQRRDYAEAGNRSNEVTVMTVDSTSVGKIIGKGGSKIKQLQEDSGAYIKVNQQESYSEQTNITLRGSPESQNKAKSLIEELISSDQRGNRYFNSGVGGYDKEQSSNDNDKKASLSWQNEVPKEIDWDEVNRIYEEAQQKKFASLPELKKNFYDEVDEVACMSPEEVEQIRLSSNNIMVNYVLGETSEKIPNPVTNFEQAFHQYPEILDEIYKNQFTNPTPIQSQAWPILLSGRDMIGIAQTGTGKTLAFLLPALIHIDGQITPRSERGGPNVLILAPTRELAQQIEKEANKYQYKGIRSVCLYGGGNRQDQVNLIKKGVEIVIATPGRMNDLVQANVFDMKSVTYLVLDEADRMLDMGFEIQIRKSLLDIRPDRQSVMTSATWPSGVRRLAEKYMKNPIQVVVGSLDLAATHSVSQCIEIVDEEEKEHKVKEFVYNMAPDDKVIIFVSKKARADDLTSELSLAGILCDCFHGDRDQYDRERALDDLKTGEIKVLIATDVAARGLDICDITHIISYDFPKKYGRICSPSWKDRTSRKNWGIDIIFYKKRLGKCQRVNRYLS
uniref:RNA helicase n=1 Tax=Clastoptera arizonana TaxID=38151 RepID=A0A1B6DU35_9HEMI